MKRRVSPFIVALPAFLALAIFKVLPAFMSIAISTKQYNPKAGWYSASVGITNYIDFLGSFYFRRLMKNTVILTLLPALITCLVALVAVILILKLPNLWTRLLALSVLAIPAFLPSPVLVGAVMDFCSSEAVKEFFHQSQLIQEPQNLLAIPHLYPWIYSVTETLRYMFYPIAIGVYAASKSDHHSMGNIARVIGGYFLIRMAFFLVMSNELTIQLYNPMVYEAADTVSSFTFRKGLLEANYGYSAAVDSIQLVLQILLNVLLIFGLKRLFPKDGLACAIPKQKNSNASAIAGILGILLLGIGALSLLYYLLTGVFKSDVSIQEVLAVQQLWQALGNSFVYSICSAIIFTALSVLLAYPFTANRRGYPVILFMLLTVNGTIAEYILYRNLGFIDSKLGVILSGGISVAGAFIVHLISHHRTRTTSSLGGYLRQVIPAAIVTFTLGFILVWSSVGSMIFVQTRSNFPISLILREVFVQNDLTKLIGDMQAHERYLSLKPIVGLIGSVIPLIAGWVMICCSKYLFRKDIAKADRQIVS